jgi:vanillate O-demethylase monooxygenase subunit
MTDTTIEPFVRNAWYVGAWPEELDDGPLARRIMNEPICLYRDAEGVVGALEDRCCHRGAPLTHGQVVEVGLQCGYHGLTFDRAGNCIEVPGQDSIPQAARVKSYPVIERQGFIWIWMGDAALADESKIVDFPYFDQSDKWPYRREMLHIKTNYMLMMDNLMDLTHLGYVHGRTIGGQPKTHVTAEMKTTRTENGCHYIRWMPNCEPPPTYVKGGGFTGKVDRWQEFEYFAPGVIHQWSGALEVGRDAMENREQDGFHLRLFHGATPETDTSFFYFWSAANGYRQDDPQATEDLYNEIYPTFIEDKEIMEAQQERINEDPNRVLVGIGADQALSYARVALRQMIDAENAMTAVAAE